MQEAPQSLSEVGVAKNIKSVLQFTEGKSFESLISMNSVRKFIISQQCTVYMCVRRAWREDPEARLVV